MALFGVWYPSLLYNPVNSLLMCTFAAVPGDQVLDKSIIQRQNMGAQVKREISIMKLVRHPYVVQLREVLASSSKIFLVCELITGGELFDKIVEKQVSSDWIEYSTVLRFGISKDRVGAIYKGSTGCAVRYSPRER